MIIERYARGLVSWREYKARPMVPWVNAWLNRLNFSVTGRDHLVLEKSAGLPSLNQEQILRVHHLLSSVPSHGGILVRPSTSQERRLFTGEWALIDRASLTKPPTGFHPLVDGSDRYVGLGEDFIELGLLGYFLLRFSFDAKGKLAEGVSLFLNLSRYRENRQASWVNDKHLPSALGGMLGDFSHGLLFQSCVLRAQGSSGQPLTAEEFHSFGMKMEEKGWTSRQTLPHYVLAVGKDFTMNVGPRTTVVGFREASITHFLGQKVGEVLASALDRFLGRPYPDFEGIV